MHNEEMKVEEREGRNDKMNKRKKTDWLRLSGRKMWGGEGEGEAVADARKEKADQDWEGRKGELVKRILLRTYNHRVFFLLWTLKRDIRAAIYMTIRLFPWLSFPCSIHLPLPSFLSRHPPGISIPSPAWPHLHPSCCWSNHPPFIVWKDPEKTSLVQAGETHAWLSWRNLCPRRISCYPVYWLNLNRQLIFLLQTRACRVLWTAEI